MATAQLGLKEALSPYYFAKAAGFDPDPWQTSVLRSHAPRMLLNCSRQSGKSTVVGILACHELIFESGSLTLLQSRAQRQSQELFRKVMDIYRAVGSPMPGPTTSTMTLELSNRSRVVALPGSESTTRSFSDVSLWLIDEASRVKEEAYYGMSPVLAVSGGRTVALSTPFGNRGWWWSACEEAKDPKTAHLWDYYEVPATECPRIPPEFLAEEKRRIGNWWYTQEYMCQFLDAQTAAFKEAEIQAAMEEEYDTWNIRDYLNTWRNEAS